MRVLADSRILAELEEMKNRSRSYLRHERGRLKELNIALARQYDAKVIVSKDSGITGGLWKNGSGVSIENPPVPY